jgi:hypothetical protein
VSGWLAGVAWQRAQAVKSRFWGVAAARGIINSEKKTTLFKVLRKTESFDSKLY